MVYPVNILLVVVIYIELKANSAKVTIRILNAGALGAVLAGVYALYQVGVGLMAFSYDIVRHYYPFQIFDYVG